MRRLRLYINRGLDLYLRKGQEERGYTKKILKREGVLRKGNDASKKRGFDLLKNYK